MLFPLSVSLSVSLSLSHQIQSLQQCQQQPIGQKQVSVSVSVFLPAVPAEPEATHAAATVGATAHRLAPHP